MARQPLLGPGLPQKTPPFLSVFYPSPPSFSFQPDRLLFIDPLRGISDVSFQLQLFYGMRSASRPSPNVEDQGIYPFSSGSSPSTFPAWEALPVATLPPALLSGSFGDSSPIGRLKTLHRRSFCQP